MNNNSNEVKQLLARVTNHLARTVQPDKMSSDLLKLLLPTLVNGTKEKNGYVKANSEIALIAILRLKDGDAMQQVSKNLCAEVYLFQLFPFQRCLNILDVGARESLADVVSKVLKKIMSQADGKEEELDDTLLT